MKKLLVGFLMIIVLFIGLLYISVSSTDKKRSSVTVTSGKKLENIDFRKHDSIKLAISTLYEGEEIKNLMQGSNYRQTWATPVKFPVAYLDTLKGGMKILGEGGGHQTHSLKLLASNGVEYSLRSVNKDPAPVVPEIAKKLGLENVVIDGISAQHPYGAILAAALSEKAGVLHTHPQMVFIPKQKKLGKYNDQYGNHLYLLEYETESDVNWTSFDADKIIETDDLQELKQEKGDKLHIDKPALVRARLFDIIIGDWDRHAKQWGWVLKNEKGNYITAIPLAGDRDNAFFDIDGILPEILTNPHIQPLVRPYNKDIDYMKGLVYPFDVYFLKDTPQEVFINQAEILQKNLNDKAIEEAFKVWPDTIYKLTGREIKSKIKYRRDHLKEYARSFKNIIDQKGYVDQPLKGSDDVDIDKALIKCFECDSISNKK
ncbi:hypothetical protein C7S20_11840 [Christiangramia fulva]|uniref:Uncharacterized protein n=1 Tax=Christiangramia fulva TaxID=2126553 RepID=A0A2R3Z6I3_9FLAO|nr:hypothetical protein [Christiangramia fulva]AVR45886.1 hypothetical protein C7S20_11840 [Christiangramia fulva]